MRKVSLENVDFPFVCRAINKETGRVALVCLSSPTWFDIAINLYKEENRWWYADEFHKEDYYLEEATRFEQVLMRLELHRVNEEQLKEDELQKQKESKLWYKVTKKIATWLVGVDNYFGTPYSWRTKLAISINSDVLPF